MSEEKSSPIGIIIIVVAAAIITGCASGKSAGENKPAEPPEPEKPAEPKEPAFVKEGLVAYYPFNGNANDESGNGRHGKANGQPTLVADRHGSPNKAYNFDGKDDYIQLPPFRYGTRFSISVWANPDTRGWGIILSELFFPKNHHHHPPWTVFNYIWVKRTGK